MRTLLGGSFITSIQDDLLEMPGTTCPADGFVYFTDTRAYHTAVNGGEEDRVHVVASLPDTAVE